jgi:TAT-translocated FGD2 family F420-dependent dehydrogenase
LALSRKEGIAMSVPIIGYHAAHEQFSAAELVRFAVAAEEAGFEGVWASDHFHPWQDNQGHADHAWVTLAAIGQRTERLLLGSCVTCPIYRYHPAEVAQAFATLSGLCPGRVFLGVGTGEAVNEAVYSEFGPYRERADRLVEAIALIRRLWSGEWVDFEGRYFQVRNARLYDAPPQPIPIYVAAGGPRSGRLAGEHGDGWITGDSTLARRPETYEAFREGARAASKDADRMPKLVELYVYLGEESAAIEDARYWQYSNVVADVLYIADPREIQRLGEERGDVRAVARRWLVSRDPQDHVQAIRSLADRGMSHVFIHAPQSDQLGVIRFYGEEVIPALRG